MTRIAVAQFTGSIHWEENIAAVERLSRRAAEAGVKILGFHELASTVYLPFKEDQHLFELAEPESGPSVSAARDIARRNELVLVYPFFEKEGERYYNSAVVFGPRGETLLKYRKTCIPTSRLLPGANERYFFHPGDLGFPVTDTPFGVRVGMVICYDRNVPETMRCVALNGADLILVPVTTTQLVRPWWETILRTRAVENIVYVAAPSRIGEDKGGAAGAFYIGESLIVDPRGEVVGHASTEAEDLVWTDMDMDLLARQRQVWTFFTDRRPELYASLTESRAKRES